MRTLFVGGGQDCLEILELVEAGRPAFLAIEILAVVDADREAPAMRLARERGWTTLEDVADGLSLPGLQLVIELTGDTRILHQVHRGAPEGVRVIDHVTARVFRDLDQVAGDLRHELETKADLQARVAWDRSQLQHILDAMPDLVVVLDQDQRIARANQRFERVTGKTREAVHGQPIREVFDRNGDENWAEEFTGLFEQVMETGRPVSILRRKRLRSGRDGHFQITANPIFDEDLEIVRVVTSAREITELVMLQRETEESARSFQQIVDAVHGLITIKDLEGRYLVVNPWAEKIVGIPRDEMIGQTAADIFPKKAALLIQEHDQETLERGVRYVSEELISVAGKDRIFVSERLPLRDYKGDVVGVCCVSQDQTRRRRLQQELVQTERLAAIGTLAAGVAHEINNPLSGILTFAQDLLLEAEADDPVRKDYELIVNETLRCRRIVRDLLEFSRQRKPRRRRARTQDLISRVLRMVERQASFSNIEFEVRLEDDLPVLHVDPQQIQQLLLNLVINARDAMQASGRVRIVGVSTDEGRAVNLSVRDSGCGIPEKDLVHIFEPFHSTKGEKGHGLGLTAVRRVVDQHGGRIQVDSEVAVGTTFHVTLPAAWE